MANFGNEVADQSWSCGFSTTPQSRLIYQHCGYFVLGWWRYSSTSLISSYFKTHKSLFELWRVLHLKSTSLFGSDCKLIANLHTHSFTCTHHEGPQQSPLACMAFPGHVVDPSGGFGAAEQQSLVKSSLLLVLCRAHSIKPFSLTHISTDWYRKAHICLLVCIHK